MLKRGGRGDIFIDLTVKEVREPKAGGQANGTKAPGFELHSNRRPENHPYDLKTRSPGRKWQDTPRRLFWGFFGNKVRKAPVL